MRPLYCSSIATISLLLFCLSARDIRLNAQDPAIGRRFKILFGSPDGPGKNVSESLTFTVAGFAIGKHGILLTDLELKNLLHNPGVRPIQAPEKTDNPGRDADDLVLYVEVRTDDKLNEPPFELTFEMFMTAMSKLEKLSDANRSTSVYVTWDKPNSAKGK
jgi:hypothetical protein